MTALAYLDAAFPVTNGGAVALAAIAFDALLCLFIVCVDLADARRHRAILARASEKEGA